MEFFVKIFTFFIIMLFPLYLWAYSLTLSGDTSGNRSKFYAGIFSGIFSVGVTWILSRFLMQENFLIFFAVFAISFALIFVLIFALTAISSPYSRGFIRLTSLVHILAMAILFCIFTGISYLLFGNFFLTTIVASLFLSAFIEEITKHLSVLGLLGKSFRFSLRDLAVFGFCSVVGFTFIENFLYFSTANATAIGILFRSFFSFSAHLLAVMIATFFWWHALSHKFLGVKYIFYFLLGFLLAVASHTIFNYSLSVGATWVLLPYILASYGAFVYLIKK